MSLRSQALSNEDHYKFIDPISLDIMDDPVMVADGKTYERKNIEAWFDKLQSEGKALTSPLTNSLLSSRTLKPNLTLRNELIAFKSSKSTILAEDIKFTLHSDFYKELDRISQLKELDRLHLLPPKIIVVGNESHGKSTMLERIIGLPIFPKDKGLCTRCIIRVHLRRSGAGEPPIAEVSLKYAVNGKNYVAIAALDMIRSKIQEAMEFLIANDTKKRVIIDDNEVIMKISLPYCLNVDILDLPGLVTTKRDISTQNLPEVTKNLCTRIINENKDSAIFLLVNDIRVPPNQSRGCEVIQECGVQRKTLGIFTKVDMFVSEDSDEVTELKNYLSCHTDTSFNVGYGWMASASKRIDSSSSHVSSAPELLALHAMDKKEKELFDAKYRSSISIYRVRLGIHNIRQIVQRLYERFITENWIPDILTKFEQSEGKLKEKIYGLGVPLPPDPSYGTFSRVISGNFGTITSESIDHRLGRILKDIHDNFERLFVKLSSDKVFWDFLKDYHELFREPISPIVKPFDLQHSFEFTQLIGKEVSYRNKPATISAFHDGIFELEVSKNRHHAIVTKVKSATEDEIDFTNHSIGKTKYDIVDVYFNAPPITYREESVPRVVKLTQMNDTCKKIKEMIGKAMINIFGHLLAKLSPQMEVIRCAIIAKDQKWCTTYKINDQETLKQFDLKRFPKLLSYIEQRMVERFDQSRFVFQSWFIDMLNKKFDEPSILSFVTPEYFLKEKSDEETDSAYPHEDEDTYCYLHWKDKVSLEEMPHVILTKWLEICQVEFANLQTLPKIEDSLFAEETCKATRLSYLKELQELKAIRQDIDKFALKAKPGGGLF